MPKYFLLLFVTVSALIVFGYTRKKEEPLSLVTPAGYSKPQKIDGGLSWEQKAKLAMQVADDAAKTEAKKAVAATSAIWVLAKKAVAKITPKTHLWVLAPKKQKLVQTAHHSPNKKGHHARTGRHGKQVVAAR